MGTGSGDALALGLEVGVGVGLAVGEADEVWPADSVGAWVGFSELVGDAGEVGVVPDAGGVWDAGDRSGLGLGEAGELGASWAQAVMITVLVAGSALPPTPLRSTK
jgi:hypothetical protein